MHAGKKRKCKYCQLVKRPKVSELRYACNTSAANTVPCKVRLVLKQLFDLYPMVFSANLFDQKVQQIPSCSIIVWPQRQSYHLNRAPSHCVTAVELQVAILFRPTAITTLRDTDIPAEQVKRTPVRSLLSYTSVDHARSEVLSK